MTYKTLKKGAVKRHVTVFLGPLHDAWAEHAAQIGKTPAAAMTDLVRRELLTAKNEKPSRPDWIADPEPCAERKTPFAAYLTLTASEYQALAHLADDLGMSRPRYLTYLARIAATQAPLLNKEEHRLLSQCLAEFQRAGCNLNQIARALNACGKAGGAPASDALSENLKDLRTQLGRLTPLLQEKTSAVFSRAPLRKVLHDV